MKKKSYKIVTNNPLVKERLDNFLEVDYFENYSDLDICKHVRDLIHKGFIMLTHPLAGSVKPWETPYRSIMISRNKFETIDLPSLQIIEQAIATIEHAKDRPTEIREDVLADFQLVDYSVISSALPSAEAYGQY